MPEPEAKPRRDRIAFVVLMAVLVATGLSALASSGGEESSVEIRYDELKQYVRERRVATVTLRAGEIEGTLHASKIPDRAQADLEHGRFVTVRVEDPALVGELVEADVAFDAERDSGWGEAWPSLMSVGLAAFMLFFIWRLLSRSGAGPPGAMAFGKSRGKIAPESDIDVSFDDVAGADEAKEELREIIELLERPEKYQRIGAKIPKGVLLVGPPGTGKTLLARAVAGEAGVPFISINGSEFVEMFVGVGAARVRDLFVQAEQAAPCIVFIDELDALGKSRGAGSLVGNDERESTLNQLLVELDGFAPHRAVILMAATNRPEVLDPALLRAGRFDRQVLVDRPDRAGREAILRVHGRPVRLGDDVDLEVVAHRTPGLAGADLANLVNEAALLAAREDAESVSMRHLSEALDRVVAGLAKKNRLIDVQERERVAYHEVGHALCAHLSGMGDQVHKISIVPRGLAALGFTMQVPEREQNMMTKKDLDARLLGLFGGRAAEEVVFGDASTGAQNDLQRASELARAMVTEYGMSDALGPVYLAKEARPLFLSAQPSGGGYGEAVADRVDAEVHAILSAALESAKALLTERRADLEHITRRLLEAEQLEGDELAELLHAAGESPAPDMREATRLSGS